MRPTRLVLNDFSFGGLVLSQSIAAAFLSIDPSTKHHLFSVQGSYLSPSSTDVPTFFDVQDLRTTRTMLTRLVLASQDVPSRPNTASTNSASTQSVPERSTRRKILVVTLDFHVSEPSFLTYTRGPRYPGTYPPASSLPTTRESLQKLLSPKVFAIMMKQFDLPQRMFEHRPIPSSAGAQNSLGFLQTRTSQDEMDLTDRTFANWIRPREKLETYGERCAAVG